MINNRNHCFVIERCSQVVRDVNSRSCSEKSVDDRGFGAFEISLNVCFYGFFWHQSFCWSKINKLEYCTKSFVLSLLENMLTSNNSFNDEFAQYVDSKRRSLILFDVDLIKWLLLRWIEYFVRSFEMNSLISNCTADDIRLRTIFTESALFIVTFNNGAVMSNVRDLVFEKRCWCDKAFWC